MDEVKLSFLVSDMVESGKTIELQCSVNEASVPITYKFFKGNENRPFYQTFSNKTQVIWRQADASKEQEGQYHCIAFNRANQHTRAPQSNALTVKGEAEIRSQGKRKWVEVEYPTGMALTLWPSVSLVAGDKAHSNELLEED